VKINTVQTILFRQLRELNEQRQAGSQARHASAGDGTDSALTPVHARPGLITKIRLLGVALNKWLASYYRLCGHSGLESSIAQSHTILLRAHEVVRLTPESCVKHLEVRQGIVWLTGTPAQGDVLLRTGDRFDLNNHWPFVVEAIGKAEIILLS
jgi:hypothetical protein